MIRAPLGIALGVIACVLAGARGTSMADDRARPAFTGPQADTGRLLYVQHCASCHMPNLSGSNDAPELAGSNFRSAWKTRTTTDLLDYISGAMPPGGATLDAKAYASIVAHILQSNGAAAGPQPLTHATRLVIGTLTPLH